MTNDDKADFVLAITAMAATFARECDEALFEGYWTGLSDLPLQASQRAVQRAIRECERMPTCAELRKLAGVLSPGHRAVLAFEQLRGALRRHDYYASVNFDDPVINAAVRNLGGWMEVSTTWESADEFEKFFRPKFERVYAALLASGITPQQAEHLPGFHEQQNGAAGYVKFIPPPAEIKTGLPSHDREIIRLPSRTRSEPQLLESRENIGRMPG